MMVKRWSLLLLTSGLLFGCAEPVAPGPSYAELVVTYNAELETLERLEAKREKLVAANATDGRSASGAIGSLDDLLEKAKVLKEGASADLPTDPEALLEHLSEGSGEAHELASQLIDGLLGGGEGKAAKPEPTPEEIAAAAERQAAFQAELATLDEELAKQKERVERARIARDAADSQRN